MHFRCPLFVIIFFLSSSALYSQIIRGKVTDKSDHPVPYADVVLEGTTKGTITNDSGIFVINIPENIYNLKITSIGYKPMVINKQNISRNRVNKIVLEQENISLTEIEVKGTFDSATYFMQQVLKNLKKNYPTKKYSQLAFYREVSVQDTVYGRTVEAIVLMSERGIKHKSELTQYELIHMRKSEEQQEKDFRSELSDWLYQDFGPYYINKKNPIKPKGPKNSDITENLLNATLSDARKEYPQRFLFEGIVENCLFEIVGKYKIEEDELIEIKVTPYIKFAYDKFLGAEGQFVISRNDMAIISHERFQYGKGDGLIRRNVIKDSTRAYYYIEYKKNVTDGKYYTHYIKDVSMGSNTGGILGKAKSSDFWESKGKKGTIYQVNEWFALETRDFEKISYEDQMYIDEDIYYMQPTSRWNLKLDDYNITQLNPLTDDRKSSKIQD